jgi:hypothetical protein
MLHKTHKMPQGRYNQIHRAILKIMFKLRFGQGRKFFHPLYDSSVLLPRYYRCI